MSEFTETHPIVVNIDGNFWTLIDLFNERPWTKIDSFTGTIWFKGAKNLSYYEHMGDGYKMRLYFTQLDSEFALRVKLKHGGFFDAPE